MYRPQPPIAFLKVHFNIIILFALKVSSYQNNTPLLFHMTTQRGINISLSTFHKFLRKLSYMFSFFEKFGPIRKSVHLCDSFRTMYFVNQWLLSTVQGDGLNVRQMTGDKVISSNYLSSDGIWITTAASSVHRKSSEIFPFYMNFIVIDNFAFWDIAPNVCYILQGAFFLALLFYLEG